MPATMLTPYTIEFENGYTALYVNAAKSSTAQEIVDALKIKKPNAVMTVIGGAKDLDDITLNQIIALFSRGVARAAYKRACLTITGGTDFGVMKMVGQGIADRGRAAPCIGIAPANLIQLPGGPPATETEHYALLEPHHSHFVLVDADEWGDETETMYRLVRYLSEDVPAAITILVNGGKVAKKELLYCVRQNRPILVIEGSGRLADEVIAYHRAFQAVNNGGGTEQDKTLLLALEQDPAMAEIIEEGNINQFSLKGKPDELEHLIYELLPTTPIDDTQPLTMAWQQFAFFDQAATKKSKQFRDIRRAVLWAGVMAVIFSVISSTLEVENFVWGLNRYLPNFDALWWATSVQWIVHTIAVLLPIIGSILLAGANKFHPGNNWIALRGGAEDIKREIFRFRTRVYPYDQLDRANRLARKIELLSNAVMRGSVKDQGLDRYEGPIPPKYGFSDDNDGFSPLDGEAYVTHRLQNQIDFFETKAESLYTTIQRWQWIIYASGALGTFLGYIGLDAYIAVTTSMGTALASYLEILQAESTLRGYNETAQILRGIRGRWASAKATPLSLAQEKRAFQEMIKDTENALVTERAGWVENMHQALQELGVEGEQYDDEDTKPPQV